ncbi:ABC transporter, substrate binding protein [Candidatus Magnetomorum sp. HK-1]|nr:ABC transporter, substrate binding protein [Candidatus Magnetomorum sp. HK-1]
MTEQKNTNTNYINVLITLFLLGAFVIGGVIFYFKSIKKNKVKIIGISCWSSDPEFHRSIEGFKQGLLENGYVEEKNVKFIIKNPEASIDKQREIIDSFIQAKVDLIYSLTTPGTLVAKTLTANMKNPIPIVFSICTYPVESNLIASLESSENNLVGTRNYVPFSQQYYTFERVFPHIKTLGIIRRKGEPNSTYQFAEVKSHLKKRGIKVVDIAAVDLSDIKQQLKTKIASVDALFSTCDTLTHEGGDQIIAEFSVQYQKPSFACNKGGIIHGNLIGDIADFKAIGKISGEKAALILKGSQPSWMKTESPRDNYIIINKKTASALGIVFTPEIHDIAKEIITD